MISHAFYALMLMSALISAPACNGGNDDKIKEEELQPAAAIELTKTQAEINSKVTGFGLDVFRSLYSGGEELFISPLSLSLALSMTAGGASGETLEQMTATLGLAGYTAEEMGGYYQKMVSSLLSVDPKTTFEVANAIWADKSISLKDDYLSFARRYYDSEVHSDDLSLQSTIDKINAWCAANTHDKIKSILDEPQGGIMAVLLNALYFNGTWQFRFGTTSEGTFHRYGGGTSKVPMMHYSGSLDYAESGLWRSVTLPYGNGAFAMSVILPAEGVDFDKAVAGLNADAWKKLLYKGYPTEVNLILPKFKMEYSTSMKDVLIGLGMERAFSNAAEFPGISSTPLMIDNVLQKTFVDVNEKGTEAAAVTAVVMKLTAVAPSHTVYFTADRPFIFAIRECSTGALLFIGAKTK